MDKETGSIGFGITMMKRGYKVKRQLWLDGEYIYIANGRYSNGSTSFTHPIIAKKSLESGIKKWTASPQDLLADDYEIVK